ncbi:leucine-rich repeat and immunoglobulin-like domain-containing nogo receptor-interacting protein 4b [Synchiropus picturatus]
MLWRSVSGWGAWVLLAQLLAVSGCPSRCRCPPGGEDVSCARQVLILVPDNIPNTVQHLDLSFNKIRTVARNQFFGLGRLVDLDLSSNSISMIELEAFQGLPKLRLLHINNNHLKILPAGVFSGLSGLTFLDLSHNEILVFLDFTFKEMANLKALETVENDLVFISRRAFSGLQNLQELNLGRSNLTSIPTGALSELSALTRLSLCHLPITALPRNAFQRLQRLQSLTITHWPLLESLTTGSLAGLNLTSLVVSHCNLSAVPYLAVQHLLYLLVLDLSYNPIVSIQANMFQTLSRLQELHLAGGRLLRIEPGAFRGLDNLHTLNVTSNQLVTLEESVFHAPGRLRVLRLDANPLSCDCRLLWLLQHRSPVSFGPQPACSSASVTPPRELADFRAPELSRVFTCRAPRILNRRPQELQAEEGSSVLFSCIVDGDPVPSVTWSSGHKSALSSSGRIRVLTNGSLEVRSAERQDGGTYRCLASNAAGNDSLTVGLRVRGRPGNQSWTEDGQTEALSETNTSMTYPFDAKTLVIATTMGFLSFLSSVAVCFIFMFFWSQSKGQIKHTATIHFVPRSSVGGGGDGGDGGRFTMKLI